jgi:nitrate reductase assembly molybdenum cofactor insertion protein NarJ
MIAIQNKTYGPNFVFASVIAGYPTVSFKENLEILLQDSKIANPNLRKKIMEILSSDEKIDELRSTYIDLFDRGKDVNSLYETEYGRSRALVKGNELADIAGFYRAFGFDFAGETSEMLDHIAVELEFYALMVLKSELLLESKDFEGYEIVLDGRKKFLKSHLSKFIGAICERPGVVNNDFYSSVFKFCKDLIYKECENLGVEIEPESWIDGENDVADISCGSGIGCLKQ